MVLIRRERVRNELLRVLLPATAFRMGSLALQDESARSSNICAALVKSCCPPTSR